MREAALYSEFATFVKNTLEQYECGSVPSRLNGMWCQRLVVEGCCTFKELGKYLKSIADDVGDSEVFEFCKKPSMWMKNEDVVAIVKGNIFQDKYDFYRRIKKKYPNS
jgi:hypothetical protein